MVIMIAFLLLLFGVCAYALWRGGQPERLVAAVFLLGAVLSGFVQGPQWQWRGVEIGILTIDATMLVLLVWIALRADRYWPIAVAAMQVLQVVGHLLKLADPRMLPLLYWISNVVWAYPMIAVLGLGTLRHRNRVKRSGAERHWSVSSPRSPSPRPATPPTH